MLSAPPLLLNFLGEKPPLRHTNGYSIAEILLVFGIIAGILIGVWAMYTLLSDGADVQTAVAEILMLQEAAVTYKHNSERKDYRNVSHRALKPYLGQSGVADGYNIFGGEIYISLSSPKNLSLQYTRVPTMELCMQILSHFGEVVVYYDADNAVDYVEMPKGNTIRGFVGSPYSDITGCDYGYGLGYDNTLFITID